MSRSIAVPDFDLVVLGAAGDLARRKIFPALWESMRECREWGDF